MLVSQYDHIVLVHYSISSRQSDITVWKRNKCRRGSDCLSSLMLLGRLFYALLKPFL